MLDALPVTTLPITHSWDWIKIYWLYTQWLGWHIQSVTFLTNH